MRLVPQPACDPHQAACLRSTCGRLRPSRVIVMTTSCPPDEYSTHVEGYCGSRTGSGFLAAIVRGAGLLASLLRSSAMKMIFMIGLPTPTARPKPNEHEPCQAAAAQE